MKSYNLYSRKKHSGWLVGFLMVMFCFAACGGNSKTQEDPGDYIDFPDGKTDSITPTEDLGYLIVKTPDLSQAISTEPYKLTYRDVEIEVDKKYRLKKGEGCLKVLNSKDCDVEIKPGKTTSYELAAIVADWDVLVFEVDVGPKAFLGFNRTVVDSYNRETEYRMYYQSLTDLDESPRAYLFLPGKKVVQDVVPGAFDEMDKEWVLEPGQVEQISLIEDKRAFVNFSVPVREAGMPSSLTACSYGEFDCQYNHHWVVWAHSSQHYSDGLYEPPYLPDLFDKNVTATGVYSPQSIYNKMDYRNFFHFFDSETLVRMFPLLKDGGNAGSKYYQYVVNNASYYFNPEQGNSIIEGQHLDVLDAEVVLESGEIKTYPATYEFKWYNTVKRKYVKLKPIAPNPEAGTGSEYFQYSESTSFETPSGFDLPPGTYKVYVEFTTEEGLMKKEYDCALVTPSVEGEARCVLVSG